MYVILFRKKPFCVNIYINLVFLTVTKIFKMCPFFYARKVVSYKNYMYLCTYKRLLFVAVNNLFLGMWVFFYLSSGFLSLARGVKCFEPLKYLQWSFLKKDRLSLYKFWTPKWVEFLQVGSQRFVKLGD